MASTAHSILTTFDYVWERLKGRPVGLGDAEYFWEPSSSSVNGDSSEAAERR